MTNDFLDTHFEQAEQQQQLEVLKSKGFTKDDIKNIKKKIKWTFFGSMEWVYFGHWDLLAMKQYRNPFYQFSGKDFYWWTMEIALKGKTTRYNLE